MKDMKRTKVTAVPGRSRSFPFVPIMSFILFLVSSALAFSQQKPPVFKSGIDLRQLDVTVLDKSRHPVKGLTAADFRVTEEGADQKIEAFSFVDLSNSVALPEPAWAAKVASDVVTNDLESARVFVIIVDDVLGMGDLWAKREMPKSVATFVNQLGPDDVAALVFTGNTGRSINFTRDKAKLVRALDWYGTANETSVGGICRPKLRQPETFLYAAENLRAMKNRRKAIVFFGGVMTFCDGTSECGECEMWQKYVQTARESNVSVYPVDTMGLRPWSQRAADAFLSLAGYVGGHAVVNSNGFTEGLTRIFEENTSYYLLAYQPTNPEDDGRFRRVVVKVNRPGVDVASTRSYWAPRPVSAKHPVVPAPPAPGAESVTGVLPLSQLPMRASAAPFRTTGSAAAVVALSMHVAAPAFAERTRENVDVLIRKFTVDGIDYGSDSQSISVNVPAASEGAATSPYELLARVEVPKPGHYELRISAHSEATDTRGSIYVDVDVPDFLKERLSLSGVLVSALPGLPVGPARLLTDISPASPTTARVFSSGDSAISTLRIYQGGTDKLVPVAMKVVIQDASGKSVFNRTETLAADRFTERAADYQFRLPLGTLPVGEYVLTFEATAGKITAHRDVRFQKR